jgi:hypothetical protein
MSCKGLEGHSFSSGPAVVADPRGFWLLGRLPDAASGEAQRIWSLIGDGYRPIDWQLDFKSGFRWSEKTWYRDIRFGDTRGADVKVPWELARAQHLPQLALAAGLARAGEPGFDSVDRYVSEYRNHVLDFAATNPPRFGVNWVTTMDVAIRIVNWVVAYDLFRAIGVTFDQAFDAVFRRSVLEHGRHIVANLETAGPRGNHYLADIVGLLFVATYLPSADESHAWLELASREFSLELDRQFLPDGGSFEASTSYHRLSGELATYGCALLVGCGDGLDHVVRSAMADRLMRIAELSIDATTPAGGVVQVGDNDSGRLLKLLPSIKEPVGELSEDHLDHRHLVGAITGLVERPDFLAFAGPWAVEGMLVRRLAGGSTLATEPPPKLPRAEMRRIQVSPLRVNGVARSLPIPIGGGSLRARLRTIAYPDFGLFIFRSDRLFMSIRCGPVGQDGIGGHAHNDQLSVELWVDGDPWIRDPGTYVYTPLPDQRNAYRSAQAHFVPMLDAREPASLDLGLFELGRGGVARCLGWDESGFVGELTLVGGGQIISKVQVGDDQIQIEYWFYGGSPDPRLQEPSDWRCLLPTLPYSPGYGLVEIQRD